MNFNQTFFRGIMTISLLHAAGGLGLAIPRPPMTAMPEFLRTTFSEHFDDQYTKDATAAEIVLSGTGTLRESWSGYSLQRARTVVPYVIAGVDSSGHTNVTSVLGAVRLWVKPYWSSATTSGGKGPGHPAQVLELSVVGQQQAATVWSLQVSADGSAISLVSAEDKDTGVLLKAAIAWREGEWHQVILNRSEQGTTLILDGEIVAEGAPVLAVPPNTAALAVGSSLLGTESFEGELEELYCFVRPLKIGFHYLPVKDLAAKGPISAEEAAALQAAQVARMARKAEFAALGELDGGGMQLMRMTGPSADCVTNGPVYLTNVVCNFNTNDGWTLAFDIAGGTKEIPYDIFSTPELVGNDVTNSVWTWLETGYTCETHVFTNQATNQMFYILTVPGADRDGDELYDGWEWKHFGTLAQTGGDDYDGDNVNNGTEYANGSDPNKIVSLLQFPSLWVSSVTVTGAVELISGHPAQMAVLVDNSNFATATWHSYNSIFTANLGSTDGGHKVWVGLRGRAVDSTPSWNCVGIVLDRLPPLLAITNPVATTSSVPLIQLQGYCSEALTSLRFDITNAAGLLTNQQGFVSRQFYDTNLHAFTTNYFQCYDIDLTNGLNTITLRATDLADNVTVTNFSFTLVADTDAPVIQLRWPQDDAKLCGNAFTLDGFVDDPAANITLELADNSGLTNLFTGVVERQGHFWVEHLPLAAGTNYLRLTATDAWANFATTNLIVIKSDLVLTVVPVDPDQLYLPAIPVEVTVSEAGYTVWVNGKQATVNGEGSWQAENVPVNLGGTASFTVTAYPPGENPTSDPENPTRNPSNPNAPSRQMNVEKPDRLYVESQERRFSFQLHRVLTNTGEAWIKEDHNEYWASGKGGNGQNLRTEINQPLYGPATTNECHQAFTWPATFWPTLTNAILVKDPLGCDSYWGTGGQPLLDLTYCDIPANTFDQHSPGDWIHTEAAWHTETKMSLYTGGKALPHRKNLFVLSGSATEIIEKATPPVYSFTTSRPIAATQILIGDLGPLGSDGRLYAVLPDDATKELMPRVKSKNHYVFDVVHSKHKLRIVVNGICPLADDRVVTCAKFCVGQKIDLEPVFVPPVSDIADKQIAWALSGIFINAFEVWKSPLADIDPPWDESYYDLAWGLTDFRVDQYWLHQEKTRAWWLTGGYPYKTKPISLGMHVTFNNGQEAGLNVKGLLAMHKPTVSWDQSDFIAGTMHGNKSLGLLKVGVGASFYNGSHGEDLRWGAISRAMSPHQGTFAMIQLLTQDTFPESFSDWRLDNAVPYHVSQGYSPSTGGSLIAFNTDGDGPYTPIGGYITDNFKQYFVYRSDTAGSIWVTLGTADWRCHGRIADDANAPGGWKWSDTPEFYHSQSIEPSSDLPEWRYRKTNVAF